MIKMTRKAVLFDLDDTLFDFKLSEKESLRNALSYFKIFADEEMLLHYSKINEFHWKLFEKGCLTRDQILIQRFDVFLRDIGRSDIDSNQLWKIYEYALSNSCHLINGAKEILEALYDDYELYIVSNGTLSIQDSRISVSGIEKYFKKIFISQKIGFNKPDPRFFELCFKEMDGLLKSNAVIIGDSLSSDILGGKNFGISTVWFNPSKALSDLSVIPDFEISSLFEIPNILNEIFSMST